MIARAVALNQPMNLMGPTGEPWRSLHQAMAHSSDQQSAFVSALGALAADLQVAISGAISTRTAQILQMHQQYSNLIGNKKHLKIDDYQRVLKTFNYRFRYNLCKQEVEVNGKMLTDPVMDELDGVFINAGISNLPPARTAYRVEAWKNRYHPIREYLTGLKFDGGDPIGELCSHFQDEHDVFALWMRRWLIGACAKAMATERGIQNRMLVLDGPPGLGKSHFVQWLATPVIEYYYEGPIITDDKDCRLRRLWTWIWEVGEMGATTSKQDREALKHFLTTHIIKDRLPYGRRPVEGPHLTSYIGTANNERGLLNDPTGSRRFMVCHLTDIDWKYSNLNVDQIWAQAFDLYLSDEPWNLTEDERQQATAINEEYRSLDIVEETIKRYFVLGDPNDWMSTTEIMDALKNPMKGNLKPGSEIDARRLASALTALGLDRPKVRRVGKATPRGYFGIRLGP